MPHVLALPLIVMVQVLVGGAREGVEVLGVR